MQIKGKITFQQIGAGFWGIIDDSGNQWLPINLPEQLKKEGANVDLAVEKADVMTVQMWGTPVRIRSWHTLSA